MKTQRILRRGIVKGAGIGTALLLVAAQGMAQTAKVAAGSVQVIADAAKKQLAVGFRLVDAVDVTAVSAAAEGVAEPLTATWEAWEGANAPACAWMVVVDTSNPARAKTIEACKEAVRGFLTGIPKGDAVAIFGLARDLQQVVHFGSAPADRLAGVSALKADGDASKTTLIYQNLREALGKLSVREEPRKAVLLITDGKDETPGGAAGQEIEKNKLIEAAKAAGVVIHCLGFAESLDDQRYFGALKEIASQTDGLFFPASVSAKELPKGALGLLRGVMHGAGVVHVDVSKLDKAAGLTIKAKTAEGAEAVVKVAGEEVAMAIPPKPADPVPGEDEAKTSEEVTKEEADKEAEKAKDEEAAAAAKKAEEEAAKAAKKEKDARKAAEAKKRLWIYIGSGVFLILLMAAILMVRASRKRAAEEQARLAAEAARAAEEARIGEETRLAAAEATMKAEAKPLAWLEMCDAQQTRQAIRIPSLKIGRGQHNDLVLRNDSVSGNHCVLNRSREGEWSITDLNSGNGVVLNGTQVQQAALRHGDTIELGELKMRFLLHA